MIVSVRREDSKRFLLENNKAVNHKRHETSISSISQKLSWCYFVRLHIKVNMTH